MIKFNIKESEQLRNMGGLICFEDLVQWVGTAHGWSACKEDVLFRLFAIEGDFTIRNGERSFGGTEFFFLYDLFQNKG